MLEAMTGEAVSIAAQFRVADTRKTWEMVKKGYATQTAEQLSLILVESGSISRLMRIDVFLMTRWDGREQGWGSNHEEVGADRPLSGNDSIRRTLNESRTASIPRDHGEIGVYDSGSSNAEKYAGDPVKRYVRALRGTGKKSLTLHSVVTPQEGRLAYQRGKENGGRGAVMTRYGCER